MRGKAATKTRTIRLLSLLLAVSMLVTARGFTSMAGTVSQNTVATEKKEAENITEAESLDTIHDESLMQAGAATPANPVHNCTGADDGSDTTTWSYVYFGSYPQSEVTDTSIISAIDNAILAGNGTTADAGVDVWVNGTKYRRISKSDTNYSGYFDNVSNSGYRYFKWERIKWKVLNNNGSTLFVVADEALDCKDYNDEYVDITWEDSTIRSWLNDSFYHTAFSSSEQNAIVAQNVVNEDNPYYGTEGGNNTTDNVYLLSISEVTNTAYGFCSDYITYSVSRRLQTSAYANARGAYRSTSSGYEGNCWWWLRSPGDTSGCAADVTYYGYVFRYGRSVDLSYDGVVPALHINLSSGIWSMTDDGTSGDGGNGSGNLKQVQFPKANLSGGKYITSQQITLETETPEAEIYYTIDGSTPSKENGTRYTGAIVIGNSLTLKAVAVKEGMSDSEVLTEQYVFTSSDAKTVTLPKLSIGENQTGTVESDDAVRFFPGNYSLKSSVIPVAASKSTEPDGSYKLKIAIGIGRDDWLDDSTKWNQYKKRVNSLEKTSKRLNSMQDILDTFGGKTISCFEAKGFKKTPQVSAVGYYELEIDKNGNIVKNSGMFQADAKWKASADWQFITPIGPMYINLEGSGKTTGKLGVSYAIQNNNISDGTWNMEGKLTLTPGISLEGGYGISKVATIGAKGSAELPIQLIPASKGDFEAKASVHAYVIFVMDTTWDLATYKTNLWDTTKEELAQSGIGEGKISDIGIKMEDLKPVDRSYAEYTTAWEGNATTQEMNDSAGETLERAGVTVSEETEHVLQSGVMPNTLPMIKEIGEDMVMVFQANDSSRQTLDSSVLMYSVYHDNVWSEPVPVWDNGTCDMYADLQKIGDELYLVWQKENSTILATGEDGTEALIEMAEKSEICYAKYNSTTMKFEGMTYITSDDKVDMMPKLAVNGNKVTAVWISNTKNSFLQDAGTNQIIYATLKEGAFGTENVLCESQSGIDEIVPYYENDVLYAGYIANANAENNVNQVLIVSEGADSKSVSDGSTLTSNIQYGNGILYYYEEGNIKAYDVTSAVLTSITAGESQIGSNGKVYRNNEKTAILWSAPDQTTGISYIYSSVETEDGFSEPVALYNTTSSIKYLDGVLNGDGTWQFIMNTAATDEQALHSLVFVTKEEAPEVQIETVTVDDAAKENATTPISYMVTNTSEETINNLIMTITGENGLDKQITIPISIMPGENVYDTVNVDLSDVTDTTQANITICAEGQTDTSNNTAEIVIGQTDLALETVMTETEEDVCIVATVSNNSIIPAEATVTLYSDVEQTEQLATVSLGEISKENGCSYTFYLSKNELIMNENGAAYLPVVVSSNKADCNEDNNREIKIAYATIKETGTPDNGNNDNPVKDGKQDGNGSIDYDGNVNGDNTNGNSSASTDNNVNDNNNDGINENNNVTDNNQTNVGQNDGSTTVNAVKVRELSIVAPSKKLAAGKKVKLSLTVSPENATNKAVTWKTNNKKYATIDKNGKLTLKKAGAGKTVTVTATATDGSGVKATYKIKIMKHAVKSIQLSAASKTVNAGKSIKLKATIKTTGKKVNKTLKWTSSNTKYATVTKSGKVKTKKAGKGKTVTITATSTDGTNKKAKIKLKIK